MSEMAGYATRVCGRAQRELPRYNRANGMSEMAGTAAKVAVETSGSERDTIERMG